MRKTLLAAAFASASMLMTANAGKVAILVQNEPYYGSAEEIVTIYVGDENPTLVSSAFTLKLENIEDPSLGASAQVNCSFHWYAQTTGTLTPAPGVTITNIEVVTPPTYETGIEGPESYPYTKPYNDDFKVQDNIMTWQGSVSAGQELKLKPTAQSRFTLMEVTYTGTPTIPSIPTAFPEPTVITTTTGIELESATKSAQIYYTTDGSEPTTASTLYTGAFTLPVEGNYEVKAIAVENGNSSFVATYTYAVVESGLETVIYDFRSLDDLTIPNKEFPVKVSSSANWISAKDAELENEDVTIYIYKEDENSGTNPRFRRTVNGLFIELVFVKGNAMEISVPDNMYIGGVLLAGSGLNGIVNNSDTDGDMIFGGYKNSYGMWRPKDGKRVSSVEITTVSNTNSIDNIYVSYAPKTNASVDAIEVDNSNAPVVYYNLQGMQVAADNLTPGIYIKRQGSNAEKIYVK